MNLRATMTAYYLKAVTQEVLVKIYDINFDRKSEKFLQIFREKLLELGGKSASLMPVGPIG